MPEPTVGRVMWYFRAEAEPEEQPRACQISFVNPDGTVNIGGWTHEGNPFSAINVPIVAEDEAVPGASPWLEWPMQVVKSAPPQTPAPASANAGPESP